MYIFGDVILPGYYKSATVDYYLNDTYNNYSTKTDSDASLAHRALSSIYTKDEVYNKTEVDNTDNELFTLVINTYIKTKTYTFRTTCYNIVYLNSQFDSIYIKTEVYCFLTLKQYNLIHKPLGLTSLHNGKYLQSVVPGNNIAMEYVLDNSTMDPNVRNIRISADVSEYYTQGYILPWYYNKYQ